MLGMFKGGPTSARKAPAGAAKDGDKS
jgi:hypothetical protein